MIRCFKVKHSKLQVVFVPSIHVHKFFHISAKIFVRGALSKQLRCRNEEKQVKYDSLSSQNPNINFFGIESEEGVIPLKPKINSVQQQSFNRKLKEKFCIRTFGVVRYDFDNRPKFHGQYGNRNDFSFPYSNNEHSEICRNDNTVVSDKVEYTTYNISKEIHKLNTSIQSSCDSENINYSETYSKDDVTEKENHDPNHKLKNQDMSYIDKFYFSNLSEKEDIVENGDVSVPTELNFLDKNYFGDLVSESDKSCHEWENSKYSNEDFSEGKNINNFDESLKSNLAEDARSHSLQNTMALSCKESNDDALKDTLCKQLNTRTSDIKHINNVKSDIYLKSKQVDALKINTTSKILEKNSISEGNKSQFKGNKTCPKSAMQTHQDVTDNYGRNESFAFGKDEKHVDENNVITAYDFVTNLRKQPEIPKQNIEKESRALNMKVDSKGFRILKNQVADLSNFTHDEILNILKQSILYSDDNLIVLNKPYSLVIHESKTTKYPSLSEFLDQLAKELDQKTADPKLFTVHRIDKETTGCLLLARNEIMAQNLKSLFAQRRIIKKYWVLTSRVPDPPEGIIQIPIAEGSVKNSKRMVLHPHIPKDVPYRNHSKHGKEAITSYKVISESGNAALVEVIPQTGIKHQIRVHFGFGLSCPILGDHKYSHFDKLAPQKLPSDILQKLHVRQSKVRYIPMHIHAKSVTIPEYFEGRNLFVVAPLPSHMIANLKTLKFRKK